MGLNKIIWKIIKLGFRNKKILSILFYLQFNLLYIDYNKVKKVKHLYHILTIILYITRCTLFHINNKLRNCKYHNLWTISMIINK